MKRSPELKPTKYDALVVCAVLLLAALLGARIWFAPARDGERCAVVTVDGVVVERLPFRMAEREYQNNGYTVHITVSPDGVRVDRADCPTQDCVRTGTVSRAGQSIVCLPARIVVTVEGAADAGFDVIAG